METSKNFSDIQRRILDMIKASGSDHELKHALSIHKWLLELFPAATEEMQIAALAHDLDRSVDPRTTKMEGETYLHYKNRHAKRSATIISSVMEEFHYPKEVIEIVAHLVEKHEVGGEEMTDYVRDADSIAYFEQNIYDYLRKNGPQVTKEKIRFMYKRASKRVQIKIENLDYEQGIGSLVEEAIGDTRPSLQR